MKIAFYMVLGVLVLLSLAAGAAKLMLAPAEVEFFADLGLGEFWVLALGAFQVIAGGLAAIPRLRTIGLIGIAAGFALSSLMIFLTGNLAFGLVSLAPIVLAIVASRMAARAG